MVTNNYYAMLNATRLNKEVNCKNVNGQNSTLGNSYDTNYDVSVANKQSSRDDNRVTSPSYSIFVGSGNTPTTLDTYKLDNEDALLASDITISVSSISNAAKSGLFVLSRLFTAGAWLACSACAAKARSSASLRRTACIRTASMAALLRFTRSSLPSMANPLCLRSEIFSGSGNNRRAAPSNQYQ